MKAPLPYDEACCVGVTNRAGGSASAPARFILIQPRLLHNRVGEGFGPPCSRTTSAAPRAYSSGTCLAFEKAAWDFMHKQGGKLELSPINLQAYRL